jgi:K+-sensing histidine kinase KdpD
MGASSLFKRIDERLRGRSRGSLLLLAAFALLVVFIVDVVTAADVHLTVFYLLPIYIASWYVNARWGVVAALLCTVAYQFADSLTRTGGFSATLSIWNTAVIFGIFVANAASIARLRANLAERRRLADDLDKARARILELTHASCVCEACGKPRPDRLK